MRHVTCIALALLVAMLVGACGVSRPTAPVAASRAPLRRVLPNGVAVVIDARAAGEVAALQLWVRVGSRDERPEESGMAHYLEHLVLKGTERQPRGAMIDTIEEIGGRINGATSLDHTYFPLTVPVHAVGTAIRILADLAGNASLDADALQAEKGVVLEELRENEDHPGNFLGRRLYAMAFAGHPYARPVIGDADVIRALTRPALVAFYRRHYVPESLVLVVVGAIEPFETLAEAMRTFGRLARSGTHRAPIPPVPALDPCRAQTTRPGAHAYLGLAWHAPRAGGADMAAMAVLASILSRGPASRLTARLREDLGLVNGIGADYFDFEAGGVLSIAAQLAAERLDQTEAAIVAEIVRVRDEGVTEVEQRRAVTAAEAGQAFTEETVEGRAYRLGRAQTVGRVEEELASLDRIRSVTTGDIRSVARRYLDPERYVRLAVVPPRAGQ